MDPREIRQSIARITRRALTDSTLTNAEIDALWATTEWLNGVANGLEPAGSTEPTLSAF